MQESFAAPNGWDAAPDVSPPRAPPALSQPSPSYVEKYKATKPASPNGAAKSAVGANVD